MNCRSRITGLTRRAALRRILRTLLLVPLARCVAADQDEIKRQPVESSVLASVGYDAGRKVLEIEFRSGAIYRYLGVPEEIHSGLLAAESKGRFFGANIREKFRGERVNARTEK